MNENRSRLPRIVLVLGGVSLLNDVASEMIMPLLPVFLVTAFGAGPAVLGLIEGVADATASLLKLTVGIIADRTGHWRAFVGIGYALSNAARPLISLAPNWVAVLGLRFGDRVGKGLRTAPRDAMIAGSVPDSKRGAAFGFHRAMDHAGASVGPVIAFVLLGAGWAVRDVILVSFVPGMMAVALVLLGLRQGGTPGTKGTARFSISELKPPQWRLLLAAGGVAFAAVPDSLLIYWAFGSGMSVSLIPLLWAAAHVGRSLSTGGLGRLSDRFGRRSVTLAGWWGRVALLVVLAAVPATPGVVWPLFIAFSSVAACTEAVERAWISGLAPENLRASFFGAYHMIVGLAVLPGATLLGVVWEAAGAPAALLVSAFLTVVFVVWLSRSARLIGPEGAH